MSQLATKSAQVVIDLITETDPRTAGMMPGWDIEVARQKTLFLLRPSEFPAVFDEIARTLEGQFAGMGARLRERAIAYMLGIAESLHSPVELDHNLQSRRLFGADVLGDAEVEKCRQTAAELTRKWAAEDAAAFRAVTELIQLEDGAANKGDNLFMGWALRWSEAHPGVCLYSSVENYLDCFTPLYQRGMYYPDLYFAREEGRTRTQFFNDYGMQAARCRRMGSLGGTTNPVIAVMGEDDMTGAGNIWGQEATDYIKRFPNKWHQVRRIIAKEQVEKGESDDWGATRFTEWVVVDAMLGLRSVFLLRGLGRVAFQLRPDWHDDEKKLTYAAGEIYVELCRRMKLFDDILLDGADERYHRLAAPRVGKPNNVFKIACTGQAALKAVRSMNAGRSEAYPDALKERMCTAMTLAFEVPQMYASSMATEAGIRDCEARTGEKVDDGEGGSVVVSMIGRFNDAIRDYRVKALLAALPETSRFKGIDPASVKKLTDPAVNDPEFIAEVKAVGMEFDPEAEEDAVDRAGTLCTKRAVILLENREGLKRTRMLTASKRNFHQNTELLDVPFSTDFGNIQRMYMDMMPLEITDWKSLYDGMDEQGYPKPGTVWHRRHETLSRIWPDWKSAFGPDGVKPEDYENKIYVQPTLKQFTAMWFENVARAKRFAEEARS